MAKTLSNTLSAAQKAESRTPYHKIEYLAGGTVWTDVSANVLHPFDYEMRPYDGQCKIWLDNSKGTYDSFSQRDRPVRITQGLMTGVGREYQSTDTYLPYMWITNWQDISQLGEARFLLICEPIWATMERCTSNEDKHWAAGGSTIKTILAYILALAGITLGISISEDTHIDTDKPEDNSAVADTILKHVQTLMGLTYCWLVPRLDTVHCKYNADADASVATYHLVPKLGQHACFYKVKQDGIYSPTKVVIEYADGQTVSYDAAEAKTYSELIPRHDLSAADATTLAETIVKHAKAERVQGTMSAPIDLSLELYDVVTVIDTRSSKTKTATGRVGGIHLLYQEDVFNMGVAFGGVYHGVVIPVPPVIPPVIPPAVAIPDVIFAPYETFMGLGISQVFIDRLVAKLQERRTRLEGFIWQSDWTAFYNAVLAYAQTAGIGFNTAQLWARTYTSWVQAIMAGTLYLPPSGSALQLGTPTLVVAPQATIIDHRGHAKGIGSSRYYSREIQWHTAVESLDGFRASAPGGTVQITLGAYLQITTAALTGLYGYIYKTLLYGTTWPTWDKRRRIKTKIQFDTITNQEVAIVCGLIGSTTSDYTARHIGFKVLNGTIYGTVGDGSTEATAELATLSMTGPAILEAVLVPGAKCEFYGGDVLLGIITTNLPTGSDLADYVINIRLGITADEAKQIRLSDWYFLQEES